MDKYLEYALETLKKLISIPTVNPPGENYRECAEFLRRELESMGFDVELIEVPEEYLDRNYPYAPRHRGHPRYIVVGRSGRGEAKLHFNGHYDVVPPGTGWTVTDPFKPVVIDGKVYGRGATDMKGGIASLLAALKACVDAGWLKEPVEVAFVPDEESGGVGTKYLVEEVGASPKYVVIPEPTTSCRVAIGHKGMVRGLVTVYGKQSHASRPWKGVNAFEKACHIVVDFLNEFRSFARRVRSSFPFTDEEARYVTVSLGGYAASSAMKDNIVPGEFTFSFDMRTIPEVSNEEAFAKFLEILEKCARKHGVRIEVKKLLDIPAAATDPNSPLVKYVIETAEKVIGKKPTVFVNTGRYDLVYYAAKGSQVAVYGPGVNGQAHASNEYTTVDEISKFIKIYTELLKNAHTLP